MKNIRALNSLSLASGLAAFAMIAGGTTAQAANLLTNGSFETGGPTSGGTLIVPQNTTIPGWTALDNSGQGIAWINGTGDPYGLVVDPNAGGGTDYLDLTGVPNTGYPYDGVSQTIATTDGDEYQVTFDVGQSGQYDDNGVDLPGINVGFTGSSDFYAFDTSSGANTWQTLTTTFVATGSSTVLSLTGFAYVGGDEVFSTSQPTIDYIGLDNVSLTDLGPTGQTGSSGVPDSGSTWILLAGVVASLLFWKQRQTARG